MALLFQYLTLGPPNEQDSLNQKSRIKRENPTRQKLFTAPPPPPPTPNRVFFYV